MLRKYVCNKYRSYSIRNHYFVNGLFETSDPKVQALIENADGYGVFIHPVETKEEITEMKKQERAVRQAVSPQSEEPQQLAHQGARGTLTNKGERGLMVIQGSK